MQVRGWHTDGHSPEERARKVLEMARLGFGVHIEAKGSRGEHLLIFLEGAVAIPERQDGARRRAEEVAR